VSWLGCAPITKVCQNVEIEEKEVEEEEVEETRRGGRGGEEIRGGVGGSR